jgi:hypothetical protein
VTDYSRDHLGRPVSEDGHWVWNGTEWAARTAEERALDTQAAPAATLIEEQPQVEQVEEQPVVEQPVVDYFPEPTPQAVETPTAYDPLAVQPVAVQPVAPGDAAAAPDTASFQAPPVMDFRAAGLAAQDEEDEDEALSEQTFGGPKPVGHRAIRPVGRSTGPAADFSTSRKDGMSLGRLAATTVGVVLALAGALAFAVATASILIMRAYEKAIEEAMTTGNSDAFANAGPGGDTQTTMYLVYAIGFVVATLAAFSVLYAARVPKAIIGAAAIVVLSFAAFYGIDKSGVEIQSWTGIFLLPLVPAIATAGFVKWATR